MNFTIMKKKYWFLGIVLFVGLAFIGLTLVVENKIPIDGLLKVGFPLVFYTKGNFPPNERINSINLIIDLLIYFFISLGMVIIAKYLIYTLQRNRTAIH